MPRGTGRNCLPLVRLRYLPRLARLLRSCSKERRCAYSWWNQEKWASHVAGLEDGEQHASYHVAAAGMNED